MALKYLYVPSGYKASKAYGVLPNDSTADFDEFERNTLATRTNKDGLIETIRFVSDDLVINGNFATDSNWDKSDSSITISSGKARFNNTPNSQALTQNNRLTTGKSYEVTFTVGDYEKGAVKIRFPFTSSSVNSNGVHVITGVSVSSSGGSDDLRFQAVGETTLSIDNVSVKETEVNIPRIDYSDGECPSLLLEPQRTNECRASENIMVWSTNRSVDRFSNQVISPDGSKSADIFATNEVNAGVYGLFMTTISNTVYSTSVYAKHISGGSKLRFGISTHLHFSGGNKIIVVDLSDGSIVSNQLDGVAEPKVIDVGNGWYRLMIEHSNAVSGGGGDAHFLCYAEESSFSEFSVWGGQIEVGGYSSSYIPNANTASGGQITRNRDKGNFAGNFDFNSNEGVLEARFKAFPVTTESRRITLGEMSANNQVVLGYIYNNGVVKPFLLIKSPSGQQTLPVSMPSSFNIFDYNTYKFKFQSGNNELKINGELVDIESTFKNYTFLFDAALYNVSFNSSRTATSAIFYGGVKHIKIYDSITDF